MSSQSSMKSFFGSSIGAKIIMAVTGFLLYGFLISHMLGNLTILMGPEGINAYAAGLHNLPFGALWVARAGLIVFFGLHILMAIKLTKANRDARPVAYAYKNNNSASYASRVAAITGALMFAYLVFHLANFTFHVGVEGPFTDSKGRMDVYRMVVGTFAQPVFSFIYIAAMVVVGFHMSHGLSSMFQTLGLGRFEKVGPAIGWPVALGFILIPVLVMAGVIS